MPLTVRSARFTSSGFVPLNCLTQRSTFASRPPPCPGPKKKTPRSPSAASPPARGTTYEAFLIMLFFSDRFHSGGSTQVIATGGNPASGAGRGAAVGCGAGTGGVPASTLGTSAGGGAGSGVFLQAATTRAKRAAATILASTAAV